MTIPDKAAEAAARWLHDQDCRSALHSGLPADFPCYDWQDEAKELLEICAPFIAAQAWDEGVRAGKSRAMRHMSDEPGISMSIPNPYRSEQ